MNSSINHNHNHYHNHNYNHNHNHNKNENDNENENENETIAQKFYEQWSNLVFLIFIEFICSLLNYGTLV